MHYYIYLTTNKINNKKYIGQHKGSLTDRYFGSGILLQKAIEKYGKDNFAKEILEICNSQEELDEKEKYWIKKYDAINSEEFYNLSEGGQKGDGWKAFQRWRQHNPEKAKELGKKSAERLRQWEKEHPEEQKKNTQRLLDAAHDWAKNNPDKVTAHMKKVNAAKEKWQKEHPEEHKKQVDEWRKSGSDANSQKIICVTTGAIYQSQSEAERQTGVPQANISKCLRGERKSAGKHPITKEKLIWRRCEE